MYTHLIPPTSFEIHLTQQRSNIWYQMLTSRTEDPASHILRPSQHHLQELSLRTHLLMPMYPDHSWMTPRQHVRVVDPAAPSPGPALCCSDILPKLLRSLQPLQIARGRPLDTFDGERPPCADETRTSLSLDARTLRWCFRQAPLTVFSLTTLSDTITTSKTIDTPRIW